MREERRSWVMDILKRRLRDIKAVIARKNRNPVEANTHIGKVEIRDGVAVVRIKGKITFDTYGAVKHDHMFKFQGITFKNILADFREVKEIDSSVIASLVDRLKLLQSRTKGAKIGLINLSPKLRSLLDISKTRSLFKEYASEDEAIAELK